MKLRFIRKFLFENDILKIRLIRNGAAAAILCDSQGNCITALTRKLEAVNVLQAELWANLDGLNLSLQMNTLRVILESDAKQALDELEPQNHEENLNPFKEIRSRVITK